MTTSTTGCQGDSFRMDLVERLPRVTIAHHVEDDGAVWGTRNRAIVRLRHGDWQTVGKFPVVWPRDHLAWTRLTARITRADKCNVYVTPEGAVLCIRGARVYRLNAARTRLEPLATIHGDCVLHGGICTGADGWSYFGEYSTNPRRDPVRLWRAAPDLNTVEVALEFPAGDIRHIHGVFRDPFDDDALWATTGDYEDECYLIRSRDGFRTSQRIGDGSQIWRGVTLLFTPTHVCWLTDSHIEQNYACRLDRASGELEIGQQVDCSSWYGTRTRDGLYVGFTTVEKGPAIKRNECSVMVSADGFRWTDAGRFKKDFLPPSGVFKYGVISCPSGMMDSDRLYISGEGLRGLDGRSLCIKITREER